MSRRGTRKDWEVSFDAPLATSLWGAAGNTDMIVTLATPRLVLIAGIIPSAAPVPGVVPPLGQMQLSATDITVTWTVTPALPGGVQVILGMGLYMGQYPSGATSPNISDPLSPADASRENWLEILTHKVVCPAPAAYTVPTRAWARVLRSVAPRVDEGYALCLVLNGTGPAGTSITANVQSRYKISAVR